MTRLASTVKKVLLTGTVVLLCCDVSMLFAAENSQQISPSIQQDIQLKQLHGQVQDQLKAVQGIGQTGQPLGQQASLSGITQNDQAAAVNAFLGRKETGENVLPPVPFENKRSSAAALPAAAAGVSPPAYQSQSLGTPNALLEGDINAGASKVTDADINETAFNAMVQNSLPMSPEQIIKLRSYYMASQFAAVSLPKKPARPVISSIFANLSPGATPPVVRLAQGRVTSILFLDASGQPWPIESYDVGDPSVFNIQWNKINNIMAIQPSSFYKDGNLQVTLKGSNTPVVIDLIPGQEAVDYRVDMHVPGYGPNAKAFNSDMLPASRSPDLLNILEGVPPPNSQMLKVKGGDCQAWLANGKMYVRTRLSLLSPGWNATLSSADGMHAYEMNPTPSLLVSQNTAASANDLLVSQHGQVITLQIEGF